MATVLRHARRSVALRHLDGMIRQAADRSLHPIFVSDYLRLVDSIRRQTTLLHPCRLQSSEKRHSIPAMLAALVRMTRHVHRFYRSPESVPSLHRLGASSQWIRWVQHCLEPVPGPPFLSRQYLNPDFDDWSMALHFHLADGGSLRRFPLPDGSSCDKVVARYFMNAPHDASVSEAFRWGQFMAISHQSCRRVSHPIARRVMSTFPLTADREQSEFAIEWLRLIERVRPPLELINPFYQCVVAAKYQTARECLGQEYPNTIIDPDLRLIHWSLRRCRRFVSHWKSEYRQRLSDQRTFVADKHRRWDPMPIEDHEFQRDGKPNVLFRQLHTVNELKREGERLSHCVATYASRCQRGISAIWSLREQVGTRWRPRVTLEVRRRNRTIVMVRGRANRVANEQEWIWIHQWAQMNQLEIVDLTDPQGGPVPNE